MLIEGTSSAELRDQCMRDRFAPIAKELFARMPGVQCIAYTVGQYWCDEAVDAVHEAILTFLERDPKWPQGFDEAGDEARKKQAFGGESLGYYQFLDRFPCLDDNGTAITAFASFCSEMGDQEQPFSESHVVYAWARRGAGEDVAIDLVGTMSRPEWEDRFDVGFAIERGEDDPYFLDSSPGPVAAAPGSAAPSVESATPRFVTPPPPPAPQPRGFLAFLRRLFGG
jgi:hypothetical protein